MSWVTGVSGEFRRVLLGACLIVLTPIGVLADSTGTTAGASVSVYAVGSGSWSNLTPGALATSGGGAASASIPSGASSDTFYVSDFGLSVPAGSVITGVRVQACGSVSPLTTDLGVHVRIGAGEPTSATRSVYPFSTCPTFGGSDDTWTLELTPEIVNAPEFGLFATVSAGTNLTVSADIVSLEVFYSPPSSLGALNVYDQQGSCVNENDPCADSGILLGFSDPGRAAIEAIRNQIELFAQDHLVRFGWDGAGGAIDVFLDSCRRGSMRCGSGQPARIFLTRVEHILGADDDDATLDVVAHEYYHGLLEAEEVWNFGINAQSVTESLCDIFAVAVDDVPDSPDDPDGWTLGEGSTLSPLRDFTEAFTMSNNWDDGNPYTNANIHNHAAYLWTTSALAGDRITMAQVYYDAARYLPPFGSDFSMLRIAAIEAARNRGLSPSEIAGLEAAYDAVEITGKIDPVWVDSSHGGARIGTDSLPFTSVDGGRGHLKNGGTLKIKSADYSETLIISQPMRIEAVNGPARIGTTGARSIAENPSESGFISRN